MTFNIFPMRPRNHATHIGLLDMRLKKTTNIALVAPLQRIKEALGRILFRVVHYHRETSVYRSTGLDKKLVPSK